MIRILIIALTCFACDICLAQTQTEMNLDAGKAELKADSTLNAVYKAILKEYKADTAFTHNLIKEELLWIKLRDAQMSTKFPAGYSYGTMQPMCESGYKERLTNERVTYLKQWLIGVPNNEGCRGSVKFADVEDK